MKDRPPKDRGGERPAAEAAQRRGPLHFLKVLGPGVITGAADDDPSGIATYSQTGAQFGFGQLWTSLYQIPLLLAVQEASFGSVIEPDGAPGPGAKPRCHGPASVAIGVTTGGAMVRERAPAGLRNTT